MCLQGSVTRWLAYIQTAFVHPASNLAPVERGTRVGKLAFGSFRKHVTEEDLIMKTLKEFLGLNNREDEDRRYWYLVERIAELEKRVLQDTRLRKMK